MTEKQKEAIEILNSLMAKKDIEGQAVMSSEEYFLLLELAIGNPQEIQYVPQVVPPAWPLPLITYRDTLPQIQRWEVTCKVE